MNPKILQEECQHALVDGEQPASSLTDENVAQPLSIDITVGQNLQLVRIWLLSRQMPHDQAGHKIPIAVRDEANDVLGRLPRP